MSKSGAGAKDMMPPTSKSGGGGMAPAAPPLPTLLCLSTVQRSSVA